MNRRKLLGAVGLSATGVAGLLGNGATDAKQETTTETTTTTGGDGFDGIDPEAERPFATISVGSRDGVQNPDNNLPHLVRVWNDSQQARTVGLRLVRGGVDGDVDGETVVDRRVEFPADGYLSLRLLEPARYRLAVEPGGGTGKSVEIPRTRFDCNESRTDMAVRPDGSVRSLTFTTELACPPEVVDRTFTALGGTCGSADDASVSFGAESVEVSGSIRAPNPCHGAELAAVSMVSADTLRVVVATTKPTAAVCATCLANVEYTADLQFRDRVPGAVEVVHRRENRAETVAKAQSGGDGQTTTAETTTE